MAAIDTLAVDQVPARGAPGFTIQPTTAAHPPSVSVPPDIATCTDCLRELRDPGNRRFRHPFITCTNCGPRFTIITGLPYDRPATTMREFAMCARCREEYHDPDNRRHHAQPIACPDCGPSLRYRSRTQAVVGTDEVVAAVHDDLAAGLVVALKGLGGYHLAADATNDDAVGVLRARKHRADKPFAVMVPDLDAARSIRAGRRRRRSGARVARPARSCCSLPGPARS